MVKRETYSKGGLLPSKKVAVHVFKCPEEASHAIIDIGVTNHDGRIEPNKEGKVYVMVHGGLLEEYGHHLVREMEVDNSGKILELSSLVVGRGESISIRNESNIDLTFNVTGIIEDNPAVIKAGVLGFLESDKDAKTKIKELYRLDTPGGAYMIGDISIVNREKSTFLDLDIYIMDGMSLDESVIEDEAISLMTKVRIDGIGTEFFPSRKILPNERIEVKIMSGSKNYEIYFSGIVYSGIA